MFEKKESNWWEENRFIPEGYLSISALSAASIKVLVHISVETTSEIVTSDNSPQRHQIPGVSKKVSNFPDPCCTL